MSLTQKILTEFKSNISSFSLSPYADGRFEVFLNEKNIYSKLETGEFPNEDKVVADLAAGS